MKFIDTIEIKNFKSIRHQKIEGCKRVNVFIGYPNVGKSNILEALGLVSYFQKSQGLPLLQNLCRYKEFSDLFFDGNVSKNAEIFINQYLFSLNYVNSTLVDFTIINREEYPGYPDQLNKDHLKAVRYLRISKSSISVLPEEVPSSIINLKKYHFKSDLNLSEIINAKELIAPFGDNLFEVIKNNKELRKEIGEYFQDYNLKLLFDETNNLKALKQIDEWTILQIHFSQIADTLQRLIFYKAAIATNENTVLLFEEPEAHMFPPYISKFTADVMYNEKQNQFFNHVAAVVAFMSCASPA